MEFLKDYDFGLNYYRGKAIVVADVLSRKSPACIMDDGESGRVG